MKRLFYLLLTSLLTLVALANVAAASNYTNYQPAVPSKLQ